MSSNTANVSKWQQKWITRWLEGLDRLQQQEQNTPNPDDGQHLENLDVRELENLNKQKPSKPVQQALERRKAEEVVAQEQITFCCPIGLRLMKNPVVAADGHTYERKQIETWFASWGFSDLPVKSPKTNLQLEHTMLIPNHALRIVIQDAVDKKIAIDESVGTVRTC